MNYQPNDYTTSGYDSPDMPRGTTEAARAALFGQNVDAQIQYHRLRETRDTRGNDILRRQVRQHAEDTAFVKLWFALSLLAVLSFCAAGAWAMVGR